MRKFSNVSNDFTLDTREEKHINPPFQIKEEKGVKMI